MVSMADDEVSPETFPPILVTQTELSARIGLTTRWIRDLTQEGVFQQVSGKKYDLCASMLAYGEYKLAQATEKKPASATDKLAARKEEILQRRLDRESRTIITMSESMTAIDMITGAFNEAISGLPARITRNIDERKRIETICDGVRTSLDKAFGEHRISLQKGLPPGTASDEEDA